MDSEENKAKTLGPDEFQFDDEIAADVIEEKVMNSDVEQANDFGFQEQNSGSGDSLFGKVDFTNKKLLGGIAGAFVAVIIIIITGTYVFNQDDAYDSDETMPMVIEPEVIPEVDLLALQLNKPVSVGELEETLKRFMTELDSRYASASVNTGLQQVIIANNQRVRELAQAVNAIQDGGTNKEALQQMVIAQQQQSKNIERLLKNEGWMLNRLNKAERLLGLRKTKMAKPAFVNQANEFKVPVAKINPSQKYIKHWRIKSINEHSAIIANGKTSLRVKRNSAIPKAGTVVSFNADVESGYIQTTMGRIK